MPTVSYTFTTLHYGTIMGNAYNICGKGILGSGSGILTIKSTENRADSLFLTFGVFTVVCTSKIGHVINGEMYI